jgi:hypothetical protein
MRRSVLLRALTALLFPTALAAVVLARVLRLPELDLTLDPFEVELDLAHPG